MLQSRAFYELLGTVFTAALILARVLQFFAMGWRWKITQEQIDGGFNKSIQRKEFWVLVCFFLVVVTCLLIGATRFAWH